MLHRLILENPMPLFTAVFLVAFFLLSRLRREASSAVRLLGLSFGMIAVLAYISVLTFNMVRGGLLWHDEANILSIAAAWHNGQMMYHPANTAEFYTLFYGPATYLAYVPLLHATTHSLLMLRIMVSLVDALTIVLLFGIVRAWLPTPESIVLISIAIVTFVAYPDQLLGLRGDPWLVFLATLAVFLVMRSSQRWAVASMVIAGAAMGLAIDLKATVLPAMCVVAVIAFHRLGKSSAAISAVVALIVSFGVFLLHGISMSNYMHSLEIAGHQPFLRSTFLLNLLVLLLLLMPSLHLRWRRIARAGRRKGEADVLLIALTAIGVCVATGSKFSAGPWHLWPLVPFLLLAGAYELNTSSNRERTEDIPRDEAAEATILHRKTVQVAALAIAGGMATVFFCFKDLQILRPLASHTFRTSEAADLAELQKDMAVEHARTLVMGYGSNLNDERTNLRYQLQLAGEHYQFDENEVVEAQKESLDIPAAAIARIRSCADDWLIPHGDVPFSAIRGGLVPGDEFAPMFPADLRSSFAATYSLAQQGIAYDLWSCRALQTARR